jgi:hypothetical protein
MDDVKQTQNPVIGVVMKKETRSNTSKVRNGRPWVRVDFEVLLRLREVDNFGWSRTAQEYRKTTGQFVSRDTLERRYTKYKQLQSAGITMIVASPPLPQKTNEVQVVVEKKVITRMPNSMK